MVASLWLGTRPAAGAGEFTINLKAQAGARQQTAMSDQPAAARPVFTARVKEVVSFQWSAMNGTPGAALSDVTLHVFMDHGAVRSDAPKPGPNALYEGAVILDFEPGGKSTGEFRLPLPESGTYFVRVETIGAAKKLGKEVSVSMQVSAP
jgi:hypothetical protein